MRLGIFGGSFDPVHNGHLELARCCQRQAALDEVWFTPTAIQPLKHDGPHATQRRSGVKCCSLAIAESRRGVSARSKSNAAVSATPSTRCGNFTKSCRTPRIVFPDGRRRGPRRAAVEEPAEIFRLATPLVMRRAGEAEPDLFALSATCPQGIQPQLVEMPAMAVSSTEIRRRVAAGEPIADLVPASVAAYIAAKGLYR